MKSSILYLFVSFLILPAFSNASAQTPASGTFVAAQNCPATRSTHATTSDSDVQIEAGQSYNLVGKNKPDATYYLIEVPGADPIRRWVATDCGSLSGQSAGDNPDAGGSSAGASKVFNLLAVSWQPAFCESHTDKTECETLTPGRFDSTHFTLHGLWPEPESNAYCNVAASYKDEDKRDEWDALPPVALSDQTRTALAQVMPGTASNLERHEWIKHGTCFKGTSSQDAYFARAIALITQLNESEVRKLFSDHIGTELTSDQIKQAFERSFGAGAGDRIKISCDKSSPRLITEMTIGLVGDINDNPSLSQLIAAAPATGAGCPSGLVDAVR